MTTRRRSPIRTPDAAPNRTSTRISQLDDLSHPFEGIAYPFEVYHPFAQCSYTQCNHHQVTEERA